MDAHGQAQVAEARPITIAVVALGGEGGDTRLPGQCRSGGSHVLWTELARFVPARRRSRRQDTARNEAVRCAGRAAYQVRIDHQSQDRKGARPRPRRRGDRMMGWMAPLRHLSAKLLSDRNSSEWDVTTIGLDLAKHVFQVHGVDAEGATVLRKQLRRAQV